MAPAPAVADPTPTKEESLVTSVLREGPECTDGSEGGAGGGGGGGDGDEGRVASSGASSGGGASSSGECSGASRSGGASSGGASSGGASSASSASSGGGASSGASSGGGSSGGGASACVHVHVHVLAHSPGIHGGIVLVARNKRLDRLGTRHQLLHPNHVWGLA